MGDRRTDLAKIHIAAKELGWSDTEYRDQMFAICRVRSSAKMDAHGRAQFLKHCKAMGWKQSKPAGKTQGRPHNLSRSAMMQKIEALLTDAARPWAYADEVTAQVTKPKKDRVAFCNDQDLWKVLTALELDARRRHTRQIQALLDYLKLSWSDAQKIAVREAAMPTTRDLRKDSEAMSIVRRHLSAMAQDACEL